MAVDSSRRIYVTFDSTDDAERIKWLAARDKISASQYILNRLALLDRLELNVTPEVVKRLSNGTNAE